MSDRINFGGRTWSAHAQDHWLEFAGKPHFPDYLRIVFVAYGRHEANGHAQLGQGDLAHFLVRADGTLPDRRNIWRALNQAVELGFLRPESRALCLVVDRRDVQGGSGNPDKRCKRNHGEPKRRQSVTSFGGQTSAPDDVVSKRRTSLSDDVSRSDPLSSQPVRQDRGTTQHRKSA